MIVPPYCSVRVVPLKEIAHIHAMTRHAQRSDSISKERLRPGAIIGTALTWTNRQRDEVDPDFERGNKAHERDVFAAYKAHKARHKIGETKNGGVGLHVMTIISERHFAQTGDVHNANNPRIKQFFVESINWADQTFGAGSVYMARLDLDEFGTGVVDMFLAPHRVDGRSKNMKVCGSKVLVEIAKKAGIKMSYTALQTSWAKWCQSRIDPTILRGRPVEETGAKHLPVDRFKAVAAAEMRRAEEQAALEVQRILENATDEANLIVIKAEMKADLAMIQLEEYDYAHRENLSSEYDQFQLGMSGQENDLRRRAAELDRREEAIEAERASLKGLIAETRKKLIVQEKELAEAIRFKRLALKAFEGVKAWLSFVQGLALGLKDAQRLEVETSEMIASFSALQEEPAPKKHEIKDSVEMQL